MIVLTVNRLKLLWTSGWIQLLINFSTTVPCNSWSVHKQQTRPKVSWFKRQGGNKRRDKKYLRRQCFSISLAERTSASYQERWKRRLTLSTALERPVLAFASQPPPHICQKVWRQNDTGIVKTTNQSVHQWHSLLKVHVHLARAHVYMYGSAILCVQYVESKQQLQGLSWRAILHKMCSSSSNLCSSNCTFVQL